MDDGRKSDPDGHVDRLEQRVQELETALERHAQVVTVLRESEERLRTLLENSPDSITVMDAESRLLYLNRTFPPLRLEEVLGTNATAYMPPEQGATFRAALDLALSSGTPQTLEVETVQDRWWQTRLVPLGGPGASAVMGIGVEVTERRRAEEGLRRSTQMLRMAADAARMGLWTVDQGRVSVDAAAAHMLGLPPASVDIPVSEFQALIHEEDRQRAQDATRRIMKEGSIEDFEYRVRRSDGEIRWLLSSGKRDDGIPTRARLIGSAFDITEKKRLDEQLRHAQKMEAVGQLTAGVAHNFNNLLTAIIPSIQLARREAPELARERLEDAEYAATRAAELVKQLMVFARHGRPSMREWVDVKSLLRRTVSICRATFDRRLDVNVVEAPRVPRVLGEAGQLEQVFLNVCLNARDALESKDADGRILLQVDVVPLAEAPGGEHVRVRISDNGSGMSDAVRMRVFEPFFTTKEVGRGTGLGLATASAIVSEAGGRISCESEAGKGTTFTILLPGLTEGEVRG